MVRQVLKRKLKIGSVVALMIGVAVLSWGWRNEARRDFKIRFEQIVDFGFEAFASDDWYNAEAILSSLFDKFGNELNLFRKMDRKRRLKARSLYGYLLFRKKNFKKSEMVLRPVFANSQSMYEFVSSDEPRRLVFTVYMTNLTELKKSREILRIFNLCYDDKGNPSEILKKIGDTPLLRSMAGEAFYRKAEYKKVVAVLKALFDHPVLTDELDNQWKAKIRWYYGKSLLCEEQQDFMEEKSDVALNVISQFFDQDMNATKLFNELSEEDKIHCRITYSQLMLKTDDYASILKLLNVFFDDKGQILLAVPIKTSEEAIIRDIYGYALCKCGKYKEAEKIWNSFLKEERSTRNLDSEEIDLLSALCKNIHNLSF